MENCVFKKATCHIQTRYLQFEKSNLHINFTDFRNLELFIFSKNGSGKILCSS